MEVTEGLSLKLGPPTSSWDFWWQSLWLSTVLLWPNLDMAMEVMATEVVGAMVMEATVDIAQEAMVAMEVMVAMEDMVVMEDMGAMEAMVTMERGLQLLKQKP